MACINPPIPPSERNLEYDYVNETTVDFWDNVTYTCKPGYFFDDDYFKLNFTLQCRDDGTWDPLPSDQLCYHPTERYCPDPPDAHPNGGYHDWDEAIYSNVTTFGTDVTYKCDVARRLQNSSGFIYDEQVIHCEWDHTWSPNLNLDPCIWVQCIDPPTPPGATVKPQWALDTHGPVEFYDNVTYTCAHSGLWFEEDRDMESFEVQCQPDGSFLPPDEWPFCVRSERTIHKVTRNFCTFLHLFQPCFATSLPRSRGAGPSYGTGTPPTTPKSSEFRNGEGFAHGKLWRIFCRYGCGSYAQFRSDDGTLYNSLTIRCQWNKTWTRDELDRCICEDPFFSCFCAL